ncbi:hypothetical protein ACJJIK_05840 [Microbulbifer sp. ZKSA006]|uniref:hypothetical protein n=1 Tax=Microbulbifer sp. ZKSA006 TaxID=3243390 RepID=UPI00403A083A
MRTFISEPSWDAVLDTCMCDKYNNAELTLTLKLAFKQVNPDSGAQSGTYHDYGISSKPARRIVRWTDAAWLSWKTSFVQSAERFWKDKFWLINNFSELRYEDSGVQYIPNIWCRFKLVESDVSPSFRHHHMIEVVRLDPSETWFGSHSKLYDSLDINSVRKGTDSNGNPIMQRAHVHEVGHLLGLGHVDEGRPHCPETNTNARPCYGVSDEDKNSVMGQGMQLRAEHANPWRRAMLRMLNRGNILTSSDWEAKRQRHYPRTLTEARDRRYITQKPART